MRFCISITEPKALDKWFSIPKQRRSRFVEASLLNQTVANNSYKPQIDKQIDIEAIDELYDL